MSSTSRSRARRPRAPVPNSDEQGQCPPSQLQAHLGYWLRAVSNHVSHSFKSRVETQGVTVAEWVVLRALFEADGVNPSELASQLGLTRGAISKLVNRLVTKQLAAVRDDPRDGRAQLVTLKASGRRLVPALAALADDNDAAAFGHLGLEQRALLLAMLKAIADRLGLRGAPVD